MQWAFEKKRREGQNLYKLVRNGCTPGRKIEEVNDIRECASPRALVDTPQKRMI